MTYPIDESRLYQRLIYMDRVADMTHYYVGQKTIEEGPDAVDDFARAQIETTFADCALKRVRDLMYSHGISNATMDGGDSPGATDYIRIECAEVLDGTRWIVCLYWAEGPLAIGTYNDGDVCVQAWTEDDNGNQDSHLPHVLVPFGLNPTNDDVLDVCEAIVKYITDNNIPVA